jgi:hypothetical protein
MNPSFLERTLLALVSILLGIWAVKGTIFLRNSLLVIGALLAGYYLYILPFHLYIKRRSIAALAPFLCVALFFLWILFHFFFITKFPAEAFKELTGTWLRAFLASVLGLAIGIIFQKREESNVLWYGIFLSFLFLIFEYSSLALRTHEFFSPNFLSFSYLGKINGVLMGLILIIGVSNTHISKLPLPPGSAAFAVLGSWLIGCIVVFYSYVFIFDTRAGVFMGAFILIGTISFAMYKIFMASSVVNKKKSLVILLAIGACFLFFTSLHMYHNKGWKSTVEDSIISLEIYDYPNWRDAKHLGYPYRADGSRVEPNTYDRISWMTAGLIELMPKNLLGVGFSKNVFTHLLLEGNPDMLTYIPSSHSAWVDLGLAYGYPGLILLLTPLLILLYSAIWSKALVKHRYYCVVMPFTLIIIYLFGELGYGHGLEILLFLISFLSSNNLEFENYYIGKNNGL